MHAARERRWLRRESVVVLLAHFVRMTGGLASPPRVLSAMADQIRSDEQQIDHLFMQHRCRHVYLDVGTNIGVQIRKLFEPHKYDGAAVLPLFDSAFGPAPRCHVCALGLEPNPVHRDRLAFLQRNLTDAGVGVLILEAAAGNADGVLNLQVEKAVSRAEYQGSSTLTPDNYPKHRPHMVRMAHLARIIRYVSDKLQGHSDDGRILMKLDIEGSEWSVVPDLMATGALCKLSKVFIEYHEMYFKLVSQRARLSGMQKAGFRWMSDALKHIRDALESAKELDVAENRFHLAPRRKACPVEMVSLDDESFLHDGQHFPSRNELTCARHDQHVTSSGSRVYHRVTPLGGGLNNMLMNVAQLLDGSCTTSAALVLPRLHSHRFGELFDVARFAKRVHPCKVVEELPAGAVAMNVSLHPVNGFWPYRRAIPAIYRALQPSVRLRKSINNMLDRAAAAAGARWASVHLRIERDWWVTSGYCRPGWMMNPLKRRCFDPQFVANRTAAHRQAHGVTGTVLLYAADAIASRGPFVRPRANFGPTSIKLHPLAKLSYTEASVVELFVAASAPSYFYGNSFSSFSRGVAMLRECSDTQSGCALFGGLDHRDQPVRHLWRGGYGSYAYDCGPASPGAIDPELRTLALVSPKECGTTKKPFHGRTLRGLKRSVTR